MGSLTAGELSNLRLPKETQFSKLRLYGFGFEPIWTGDVAGTPGRGVQIIDFDGGAMESGWVVGDITPNMVVYFNGDYTQRKRLLAFNGDAGGSTTGSITIDWHDDLSLADNDTITIALAYLPEPKFSYFEANPTVFTKDGPPSPTGEGISYTDENEFPPPHVVLGRNAVITPHDYSPWWLASGMSSGDVVAAYQFIGSITEAIAKTNLVNPGTNDLTNGVGTPTWANGSGFTFDGTNALDTGFSMLNGWTALILLKMPGSFPGTANQRFFGQRAAVGSDIWILNLVAINTNSTVNISYGSSGFNASTTLPATTSESLVTGGMGDIGQTKYGFWKGKRYPANLINQSLDEATAVTTWIGGVNDNNSGSVLGVGWSSSIEAVVVYNRQLTAGELSEITNNMEALSATTPPPGYLYVDASGSKAIATGSSLSTFAWAFSPSSAAGASFVDASASQTYFNPGTGGARKFVLSCTVTDDNGNSSVGRRAFIYDPDGSLGVDEFSIAPITENRDKISVDATVTLTLPDTDKSGAKNPTVDWDDFPENGLVIVTKNTWYGDTQKEIIFRQDSRYTDRENIFYAGYITTEQEAYPSNDAGQVTLNLSTLPSMAMYSLSLAGVGNNPSDWWEMLADYMYVSALIHHLLYWHSTVLEVMDWIMDWTDTVKRSAVEHWTEGSLLERAQGTAGAYGRLMSVTGTAQGEVFVEKPINLLTTEALRNAVTTILTLDAVDVADIANIRIHSRSEVVQITAEGGSSAGVMGSWTPFRSRAQNVKKATGTNEPIYRQLMVTDQDELNKIVGRLNSILNPVVDGLPKEIELEMNGEWSGVFSPADQEWTNTGTEVFAATRLANLRNTTEYNSLRMVVSQVTKNWNSQELREIVNVIFEVESPQGLDGRTIPIPELGTLPDPITTPTITQEPDMGLNAYVTSDKTNGVEIYINDASTWEARNTGLSTDQKKVNRLAVAPYWWRLQSSSDPEDAIFWIATEAGVLTTVDAGKTWIDRTPSVAELTNLPTGVTPTDLTYTWIDVFGSPTDVNRIIVAQATYDTGSGAYVRWDMISLDGGYSWTVNYISGERGFGIVIDQATGTQVFIVYWNVSSEEFYAGVRDLTLATVGTDESFAAATAAEISAGDKVIEVQRQFDGSVTDSEEFVFVHGIFDKT